MTDGPNDQAPAITQMNGAQPPNKSELVAPLKKKVKIEAIRPVSVGGKILKAGETAECSEEEATEACTPIKGMYSFGGERIGGDANQRHDNTRAKRI